MRKGRKTPTEAAALRRRAEKQMNVRAPETGLPQTDAEAQRLLHELQVHQVELKLQNEELRQTRDALEVQVKEKTAEVTRRTAAEQRLREQSEQVRKLAAELTLVEQRERQRLATILHDEQQQLLVGAKIRTSLLERAEDPGVQEASREIRDLLEKALEHTRSLIRELSPPILTTGGLLPAVESLARWMKETHDLRVDVRAVGARTGETAVPDAQGLTILLFRAIRELLFNVVKHAKVPTARVEIARRDGGVHVVVSDTGPGFDPASPRVERGLGGGFGLSSVRQRLEMLGGRLEIYSAPGRGSRVMLWVPLSDGEAAVPPAPPQTDRPEGAAAAVGRPLAGSRTEKIRVLVVDDHKIVRQGLVKLLGAEPDIEVVGEAADGQTAVALVRQLRPDVVTMDFRLPGMNGIEATRAIHAECPAAQVIGLSMFEEAEQGKVMRAAGAANYLSKSGPADDLVAAIRSCGRREKREREG